MLTIPFLISIVLNGSVGIIPILGPIVSGFLVGVLIGKKYPAMVVGFLGAIIGGVFCRVFLLYTNNGLYYYLLNLLGNQLGLYAGKIIQGNPFYFVLYFGLLGMVGGFLGGSVFIKTRNDIYN